jgi:hypothetical protein
VSAGRADVVAFLDALRAAETAGADVTNAWLAVCALDELRGGLRAIAEREAVHAALLTERLRELGVACTASVNEPLRAAAMARFGSRDVSDEEKLTLVLARYPDDGAVTRPIARVMETLGDDPETRELLRLVAEGEGATIAWFRAYQRALGRRVPPPPAA